MFTMKTFVLASVFMLLVIAPLQAFTTIETEPDASSIVIKAQNTGISESFLYAFDDPYYQPFHRLVENEMFPVWAAAIHSLDEVTYRNSSHISVDLAFAFRGDMLSQFTNEGSFAQVQDSDLSNILVLSEDTSEDTPLSTTKLVKASKGTNFWDITFDPTKDIESWNTVLYYSRKFKQTISYKGEKKSPVRSTVPPDKGDTIFDILEFFKKWGFPKPLTIVLLAIAAYLILAFLARE